MKNPKLAEKKITDKERKKVEEGEMEESDLYKLQLDQITEEETKLSEKILDVLPIYRNLQADMPLPRNIVKNKKVTRRRIRQGE